MFSKNVEDPPAEYDLEYPTTRFGECEINKRKYWSLKLENDRLKGSHWTELNCQDYFAIS